ncbi:hypothetical protein [Cognatilysobacter terrigena]|uniref:hypothetical protein n=1 Tax=Cognatilysobacter terrigena TaxID=2488749 RepID=UPI00105CDD30|nr:hypothetical protein [Lysobacter terrigena]
MLETIAKQLGPGFIVPALAALILGWFAKLVTDLHTGSRQSRRDFLDLWRTLDKSDDIALEVATRHLFGDYLPAEVIRAATALAFPTQQLQRLSLIWPHLRYEAATGRVLLANVRLREPWYRRWAIAGYLAGYFVLALLGAVALQIASKMAPSTMLTWMVVVPAAGSLIVAFGSLARSDTIKSLGAWGVELVDALNVRLRYQSGGQVVVSASVDARVAGTAVETAARSSVRADRATRNSD